MLRRDFTKLATSALLFPSLSNLAVAKTVELPKPFSTLKTQYAEPLYWIQVYWLHYKFQNILANKHVPRDYFDMEFTYSRPVWLDQSRVSLSTKHKTNKSSCCDGSIDFCCSKFVAKSELWSKFTLEIAKTWKLLVSQEFFITDEDFYKSEQFLSMFDSPMVACQIYGLGPKDWSLTYGDIT